MSQVCDKCFWMFIVFSEVVFGAIAVFGNTKHSNNKQSNEMWFASHYLLIFSKRSDTDSNWISGGLLFTLNMYFILKIPIERTIFFNRRSPVLLELRHIFFSITIKYFVFFFDRRKEDEHNNVYHLVFHMRVFNVYHKFGEIKFRLKIFFRKLIGCPS